MIGEQTPSTVDYASYRTISESDIVDVFALMGCAYESSDDGRAICRAALEVWIDAGGLGFVRDADGRRLFDPVEVNNVMKTMGRAGTDDFYARRFAATQRRLSDDLRAAAPDPETSFALRIARTFNLREIARETRLRLRSPLPFTSAHLHDLEVRPFVSGADARLETSPGRIEARIVTAGEREITIGADISFIAASGDLHADDIDRELYLQPRTGYVAVTDRMRRLAAELAPSAGDTMDALRAFWTYIHNEMICKALHYAWLDPDAPCDWAVENRWFDCHLGASVFVALARAREIPARVTGGHLLYTRSPMPHFWAEVWIADRGWVPFDFFGADMAAGQPDWERRDRFYGRLEPRLTTSRAPREFTGSAGVPLPAQWSSIPVAAPNGGAVAVRAADGTPIYTDTIRFA